MSAAVAAAAFLLLLSISLHSPPLLPCSAALSPDGLSLLAFKSAVSADPSSALAAWDDSSPDADPCRWPGVSCANISGFSFPRVVALALTSKNLTGYIPSELGSLVFLRRLNLHGNLLSGPIPPDLSNASSLHSLFLYSNNLSGPIPSSLCDLPRLQNLDVSFNALSGPIPDDLRSCRQLQRLLLAGNRLSGQIPAGMWTELAGTLVELDLSSNNFSGPIPPDLGELGALSGTLNLSHNRFSGEIPAELGKLSGFVSVDLRENDLSGEIPQIESLTSHGATFFLGNPGLCGYPLLNPCPDDGGRGNGNSNSSPQTSSSSSTIPDTSRSKGMGTGLIVLISAADAAGVALIGLVLVYAYWKVKDHGNGCSCTGRSKLGGGGDEKATLFFCCSRSSSSCRGLLCCARRRGSSSSSEEDEAVGETSSSAASEGNRGGSEGEHLVAMDKGFSFELDELLRSSAYVLGKSGLGIVYKVVLGNGAPVAVRRLGDGGGGGSGRYKEFTVEMQAIGKVRHPNIVRLRAYYWSQDEKLLISDYISGGNLATALRGRSGQPHLSWPIRLRIAKGVARGLAHLHECSPRKFVHGDIKPSNILLDADFNPHISDFGLIRLINIAAGDDPASAAAMASSSHSILGGAIPATKPVGPLDRPNSYRAPEARLPASRPAQKWDVYSFGVVLLELLTGKSPEFSTSTATAATPVADAGELVRWVRTGLEEEMALSDMVDPTVAREVASQHARKEVVAVFQLALSCTETDPESRPRMKSVSDNLDKIG